MVALVTLVVSNSRQGRSGRNAKALICGPLLQRPIWRSPRSRATCVRASSWRRDLNGTQHIRRIGIQRDHRLVKNDPVRYVSSDSKNEVTAALSGERKATLGLANERTR